LFDLYREGGGQTRQAHRSAGDQRDQEPGDQRDQEPGEQANAGFVPPCRRQGFFDTIQVKHREGTPCEEKSLATFPYHAFTMLCHRVWA